MSRHNRRMGPIQAFANNGLGGGQTLAMPSQIQQQIAAQEQRVQNILNRRDNIMAACIAAAFAQHADLARTSDHSCDPSVNARQQVVANAKAIAEDTCVAQMLVASTQFFRDVEANWLEQHEAAKAAAAEQSRVITPDDDVAE